MQLSDDQIRTEEVKSWKGIHLLHFASSSCSQKVRILLREKGIVWQSHPVDLARQQNVTPWFLGINPRGVVPVLVHDGVVHVESNDILEYLDDQIASAAQPFFPQNDAERGSVRESLKREDDLHMDLRTITMGFLAPAAFARKSPKTLATYAKEGVSDSHRDEQVAWWSRFAELGVSDADARAAAAAFGRAFDELDARLSKQPWLLGDRISVLEIAWFISVHRLVRAAYPLERHPQLRAHYAKLLARPAFAAEVSERGVPGLLLRGYSAYRKLRGTTLGDLLATG